MTLLIRAAKIIDPNSKHHQKAVDILIEKGSISKIGKNLKAPKSARIIEEKGLHVAPGLFDLHANFRDPGFEWKEDLHTGMEAAAKGGFTGVVSMPSTLPTVDTKAQIEYVRKMSSGTAVDIHPAGSVTKGLNGMELTEMFDMSRSGAVAFTDDKNSIQHASVMKLALLYTKNFSGVIMNQPNDHSISSDGQMNEGITSTVLGLKGIPSLAENLMVSRDIKLAEYTDGRLHFSCISTARSVELIRAAKKKGLNITADVAIHNLILDETACNGFDTRYKVNPALRTQTDIKALIKGLKDGTIDAICTDHSPEDIEHKKVEFDNASFGIIGLQTAFSLACQLEKELGLEVIIEKMAINPRKVLGLAAPEINIGNTANLCLFNPTTEWTLSESDIVSKSQNSPFIGKTLKGKIMGVVNNGIVNC
jgi:dihydroorotase